jgi:hypothetical protein
MPEPTPAARRIQLGIVLRSHRTRRGLSPKDVARSMNWYSPVKVTKVEKGDVRLSADEVDKLITLLDLDRTDANHVRDLATKGRRRDPAVHDVDWGQPLIALTSVAAEIKSYDAELIPGFLQTEDYARALMATSVDVAPADTARRVSERLERRRYVTEDNPPQVWVVLGEAALWRTVGGRSTHRRQLELLRELASRPNITLQIIPFDKGEHVAMGVSFSILHIDDPQWTFVYHEGLSEAAYYDRPPHTEIYREAFARLRSVAAHDRDSMIMLEQRINKIGD